MLFWPCYTWAAPSCNTNTGDCEDEALKQQGNVNIEPRLRVMSKQQQAIAIRYCVAVVSGT